MTQRIRMGKRISSPHTLWRTRTQWWKKPDECEVLLSPEAKWRMCKERRVWFQISPVLTYPREFRKFKVRCNQHEHLLCTRPGLCPVPSQGCFHLVLSSVLEDGWASPFSKYEEIEVRKIKITGLLSGELGNGPKASNFLSMISFSSQDRMHLQPSRIFFI